MQSLIFLCSIVILLIIILIKHTHFIALEQPN